MSQQVQKWIYLIFRSSPTARKKTAAKSTNCKWKNLFELKLTKFNQSYLKKRGTVFDSKNMTHNAHMRAVVINQLYPLPNPLPSSQNTVKSPRAGRARGSFSGARRARPYKSQGSEGRENLDQNALTWGGETFLYNMRA